jgi:ectoine hydroxylase
MTSSTRPLTDNEVAQFHRDGFVVIAGLFSAEEAALLSRAARDGDDLPARTRAVADDEGGTVRLSLWNEAGDDLFGLVGRCHRVVDGMEQLLDGEVYHYHSKMSMKEPLEGGVWVWHQDYGYWYHNACLFPHMASCFIAIDANTRENGCMQVLRGSHHMGRIEHGQTAGQVGADPDRVAEAVKVLDLVHVELEPGDALFFHCNLLHRSDANRSPDPRWSLICCYNAARNNPYAETGHPRYSPIDKVTDAAILDTATTATA